MLEAKKVIFLSGEEISHFLSFQVGGVKINPFYFCFVEFAPR